MKAIEFKNLEKFEYIRNEQFNALSVNIKFSGKKNKVIGITSSNENEGKSFVSVHLAKKYAEEGLKTLFLDTDIRKSRIIRDYNVQGVDEIVGLSHYLSSQAEKKDIIYSTNIENLDAVFAGHSVPNPTALIDSDRFDELIAEVKEEYDMVIVDTPPLLPVIDTVVVAPRCDGMLIVVEFGGTRKRELAEAKKILEVSKGKILGTVLNNINSNADKYSYYRYGAKYGKKYSKYGGSYGNYGGYGGYGSYGAYGSYGTTETQPSEKKK